MASNTVAASRQLSAGRFGKTTFLAALWHMLDVGTAISLTLEKISGDVRYLNEIKNTWIKCEQVPRTLISSEEMVEMTVRNTATDQISTLRLPDFSGETFQTLVADRHCDPELVETLNDAAGILFFVNADRANDMMAITDHDMRPMLSRTSQWKRVEISSRGTCLSKLASSTCCSCCKPVPFIPRDVVLSSPYRPGM